VADTKRTIESFKADILQWRQEGKGLRPIAQLLRECGLDVDHNAVARFCRDHDIEKSGAPQPISKPKIAPPASTSADTKPAPKQPEPLLFPGEPIPQRTPPTPASEQPDDSTNTQYLQPVRAAPTPSPAAPDPPSRGPNFSSGADFPVLVQTPPEPVAKPKPAPAPARPSPEAPSKPQPPMEPPKPWQAPVPLYAPLASGPWWTPDLPLLGFGQGDEQWFLPDALEGTFILGSTGSGKSTGSGRTMALSFLECGFGGLVLTVKPDERRAWERYAAQTGRSDQLCIVEPGGPFRLNFLDYEARRPGVGAGLIENLVSLFYTVMDVHAHGGGGGGDKALQNFWTNTGKQLLRNAFRVLSLATAQLSLEETCRFIAQAPARITEVTDTEDPQRMFFNTCMKRAQERAKRTPQERVIEEARRYWLQEFPSLAADTRSCVVTAFSAMADGFIEPAIHELFCTDTTLIPEDTLQGAIILVDLSLKRYDAVGLFSQSLWKYLFQKAIERRDDPEDDTRRPVFLWIDEAQYFFSSYDGLFQSTARSSRCATVYITQNISSFYGQTTGARAKENVDGFLGHLNTKIFHANNDPASNHWAAEQIGRTLTHRMSTSTSSREESERPRFFGMGHRSSTSASAQEVIEYEVLPSAFLNLRTGGPRNQGQVDAYFVKGGAHFRATGRHYFQTVFFQEQQT